MFSTAQILARLRNLKPELLDRYRVEGLALFGSAARGTHTLASDIDVLVDFDESATLFELVGLGQYLEEQFHCKVDVVPRRSLRPEIRENVLQEAVVI
ncbi:MAG: nucleotidyltransferase family protein [Anaerolineae bacterium]